MKRKLDYKTYEDKLKGCFLGKTVIGTLGAPYEGVKMPMELPFRSEMINTMLPNDDLDLQVLWLDVVEKYGPDFTSAQLQKAFAENCDYSPGEYAIMRKNYHKGIYPPYSGRFCNDYYLEGMGCPIRSEIWACLAPGDAEAAAELASKDGILDHCGESVYAERFYAAMESEAFFEKDIFKLIDAGLSVIPEACKFRTLVQDVTAFCRRHGDMKSVLADILFSYGHPDCTNMFQNMGITLAALILGEYDMIKTGMAALNCGFDTDCTCASVGGLLGIIHGEEELARLYGWKNVRYVLGVRSNRRSDLVSDLSEDIAALGAAISGSILNNTELCGEMPEKVYVFQAKEDISFNVDYEAWSPSVGARKDCGVLLTIRNNSTVQVDFSGVKIDTPDGIIVKSIVFSDGGPEEFTINGGENACIKLTIGLSDDCVILHEQNLIKFSADMTVGHDGSCKRATRVSYEFGVSGNKQWKMIGPIWKTTPATDEKVLGDKIGYFHIFPPAQTHAEGDDNIRTFHLNFATDTETDYFTDEELFAPLNADRSGTDERIARGGNTLFARPYRETAVETSQDSFRLQDMMGFSGPCVVYLSQILISPEDRYVDVQLGHSAPFKFFVNGELIGERHICDQWTSENAHFEKVHIVKGENRIALRLTKVNQDAKFSLIFSKGLSCASHYYDFATKKM